MRFLVDTPDGAGDPSVRARRLVEEAEARGEPVLIPLVVLVESVWVLRKVYKIPRADVVGAYRALFGSGGFLVEDASAAEAALQEWEAGGGDFADYLIGVRARVLGAREVYTFDTALHGSDGFRDP